MELSIREHPSVELTSLRICDPACGAGAFLRAALLELLNRLGADEPTIELKLKLASCLAGVDLDANATLVATISIWLTLGAESPELLNAVRNRFVSGDALLMADEQSATLGQKSWERTSRRS